jgi:hypothetical protein
MGEGLLFNEFRINNTKIKESIRLPFLIWRLNVIFHLQQVILVKPIAKIEINK